MCRFTEALEALTTCSINTELIIPASPAQVWAVFGEFRNWDKWNDFMALPVPPKCVGKHCKVVFRLDGGLLKKSVHDPEVRDVNSWCTIALPVTCFKLVPAAFTTVFRPEPGHLSLSLVTPRRQEAVSS